jgi:hypothetical protein
MHLSSPFADPLPWTSDPGWSSLSPFLPSFLCFLLLTRFPRRIRTDQKTSSPSLLQWFALPKGFKESKNEAYQVIVNDPGLIQFLNKQTWVFAITGTTVTVRS